MAGADETQIPVEDVEETEDATPEETIEEEVEED